MRAIRPRILAALALGSLLCCSTLVFAQSTNSPARGERRQTVQQRVDKMASELKLNDEQKTKVTALLESGAKKRQELRADTSLSRDERREKSRAFMKEQDKKLKEILTKDQFEQWQKMRSQGRNRPAQDGAAEKKAE